MINKRYAYFFLILITLSGKIFCASAKKPNAPSSLSKKAPLAKEERIWFHYENEPITNVVHKLAKKRNINIMLPQGTNALTAKLTFSLPYKITLDKAWQYLITILNLAGFTIVPHKEFSYIVKNDNNLDREALPFYVNVPTNKLPETDLKIRYLRYLTNLQVPGATGAGPSASSLQTLLTTMLSSTAAPTIFDPALNALLISDKARNIKSVMKIIDYLDSLETTERPLYIKLKHTAAGDVETLLNTLIPGNSTPGGSPQGNAGSTGGYFSKGTKIISEHRSNMLILLGKEQSLKRIESFIKEFIDIPQEQGASILHVYDLDYLDAATFASTLSSIVTNETTGGGLGTGQSTSIAHHAGEQYFQGVIITPEGSNQTTESGTSEGAQNGNRLIIAARKNDWIRIKKLIDTLDVPQQQVVIQAVIADVSSTAIKDLTNQLRDYGNAFIKDMHWQTGHMGGIEVESATPTSAASLQANLLSSSTSLANSQNLAESASAGSFLISFTDPNTNGIWLITQILTTHTDSKILSQPLLTTMNNKQVSFSDTETKLVTGAASERVGVEVSNQEQLKASITLNLFPRISKNGMINLTISSEIDKFILGTDSTDNRNIDTNVNLRSGEILILGGLTKTKVERSLYETPILSKIPILGNLFKKTKKTTRKTDLLMFIRPEIIKTPAGIMNKVTAKFMKNAKKELKQDPDAFGILKDPITRMFFGKDPKEIDPNSLRIMEDTTKNKPFIQKNHSKINLDSNHAKDKPSQPRTTIPKVENKKPATPITLDPEQEEKQAAQELKRLFGWKEETKVEEEIREAITGIEDPEPWDIVQENEESIAQKELKNLFDEASSELKEKMEQSAHIKQ